MAQTQGHDSVLQKVLPESVPGDSDVDCGAGCMVAFWSVGSLAVYSQMTKDDESRA